MSYVAEKVIVKRYEILAVKRDFMSFKRFREIRTDIKACELCDETFTDESTTDLAIVKENRNLLLCRSCSNKAIEGGAREIKKNC